MLWYCLPVNRGLLVPQLVGVALVGIGLLPTTGRAQSDVGDETTASEPENAGSTREASERFRLGMEHFDARRFREAIREFELAARLVPSADLWFNIARAHEELNELEAAADNYGYYLRDRVDPPDREQVEALIAQLRERAETARLARRRQPTTGTLRVQSTEAEAEVAIDERAIGQTPIALPLTLEPGNHHVSVRRDGFIPFESKIQIDAGITTAAYADLAPATAYRSIRGDRIFTWIVGGVAVASLVPSAIFSIQANGQRNDRDFDAAEDSARLADVFLATSLVLGVGAVLLYFLEGRSVGTERVDASADGREVNSLNWGRAAKGWLP